MPLLARFNRNRGPSRDGKRTGALASTPPRISVDSRPLEPIRAPARCGRRTKDLVKELRPGEIAVIAHRNIDRVAAEDLIACGVVAVVNQEPSTDGRYPNPGPLMLAEAGIRLVDFEDIDLIDLLAQGQMVELSEGTLSVEGVVVAVGQTLSESMLAGLLAEQQAQVHSALADFAENTVEHIRREGQILTGRIDLPETSTTFRDRHVLIVVRGQGYRRDLEALSAYIREVRPVLVGVDGGADAILEAGHHPDVILGDMDSASDRALGCGAELIVHAYPDGRAPGLERIQRAGLGATIFPYEGTSQDVAMLLAHEKGAALVVSVGTHFNLVEFMDKNREGMSSTFLTRLRIGESLVDAKGVSRLYSPGLTAGPLLVFLLAFLALALIVILASPALADLVEMLWLKVRISLGL